MLLVEGSKVVARGRGCECEARREETGQALLADGATGEGKVTGIDGLGDQPTMQQPKAR